MSFVRRFIYLIYYFKELDWPKFDLFIRYVKKKTGVTTLTLWSRIILCSLRYNISLMEYFQFRFYEIPDSEKKSYAGTGFMYEYQLRMNPKEHRALLSDKLKFLQEYNQFIHHKYLSLVELEKDTQQAYALLKNHSGKVVLKSSTGQCGVGIEVHSADSLSPVSLIEKLKSSENNLVEEFVTQHDSIMALSPSGLNTVRIITQLNDKDEVDILGARLRITVNSVVDNLAAGNMAAPINDETGKVEGPGVYSDITKENELVHPVTGVSILNFQIPYWKQTIDMVKLAALHNKSNRSIGWDVAITNTGPELIEGNHDWCKLLWQLPVRKGLKGVLLKYGVEQK